ncbi:Ribosomal protein L18ae family [Zea mays]|uniref:Ribosomal protein L18ae family n=1 Tax=Zea mays TaxID=4577 RepID=K7V2M6_MAIZE|nr:Ribosomal protein L18ae family [Zea mays]
MDSLRSSSVRAAPEICVQVDNQSKIPSQTRMQDEHSYSLRSSSVRVAVFTCLTI